MKDLKILGSNKFDILYYFPTICFFHKDLDKASHLLFNSTISKKIKMLHFIFPKTSTTATKELNFMSKKFHLCIATMGAEFRPSHLAKLQDISVIASSQLIHLI